MNNIEDLLLNTTIRIDTYNTVNGQLKDSSGGTAFCYGLKYNKEDKASIPVLITNKHVVENWDHGIVTFKTCDDNGNHLIGQDVQFDIDDFKNKWIYHPNKSIDLCILPIGSFLDEINKQSKKPLLVLFTQNEIIKDEELEKFSHFEELYFLGYPDLISDTYNNVPIIRKGITATSIKLDYQGKPEFLIDGTIFGGSSGSPVIIYKSGAYVENNALISGTKLNLVGIISNFFKHSVKGEIVEEFCSVFISDNPYIPSNLGKVIKAKVLLDFEKMF